MKYIAQDEWFEFPKEVAVCPICGASIVANFDEWYENGEPTECGFHVDCKDEPEMEDSDEWEGWFSSHWSMPYVDWLPLETRLYKWFIARYRLRLPTSGAVDGGEGAGLPASSTPEANPAPEVSSRPAHHH